MLIQRDDGYMIDTDPQRLDLGLVHQWLATDAYWALGRPADVVARSFANSLAFGVYDPDGALVGVARIVTDQATFAWLCDVYIEPGSRGRGLGTWLAQSAAEHLSDLGVRRVLLATRDAHAVYGQAGFTPLLDPGRWMEIFRGPPIP